MQSIYPGRILRLKYRETKAGSLQETGSDELSIVFPGIIARFDGSDLQVLEYVLLFFFLISGVVSLSEIELQS
jgi:hypothetical protein